MRSFHVTKHHNVRQPFLLCLAVVVLLWFPLFDHSQQRLPREANTALQAQQYRLRELQRQRGRQERFEQLQAQYAVDCLQVSCLALTFDDGPNAKTTPQVLSELEAAHVPATFFLIGKHIPGNEQLVARMYGDGYEIGNHTWSHPDLSKLSIDQVKQEVNKAQNTILAAGGPVPKLFRPPFEAMTPEEEKAVPLRVILWNEDPKDWHAGITTAQVVEAVEAAARPGGIVDMHDIYHTTADALPQILTDLQARGFHFVTVSQLLAMDPDNDHVFYGFKPRQ